MNQTSATATRIVEAGRASLLAEGYAGLSTRKIADVAGVPLSQIHYHFGGMRGLVVAVLDRENTKLIERQRLMYGSEAPLWKRYEQACDFLDEDLASGYVRVLQEMIAAGWSDPELAAQVLAMLQSWFDVLHEVVGEAEARFGSLGPFAAADIAGLIGLAFLGGEAVTLLDPDGWGRRARGWLRSVGILIKQLEEA